MPKLKYTGKETIDAGSLRWSEGEVRDVSQEYFNTWIPNYAFVEVKDIVPEVEKEEIKEIKIENKIKVRKNKI